MQRKISDRDSVCMTGGKSAEFSSWAGELSHFCARWSSLLWCRPDTSVGSGRGQRHKRARTLARYKHPRMGRAGVNSRVIDVVECGVRGLVE